MYCKNCGAEINDKAVICVKCGRSVTGSKDDMEPSTNLGLAIFSMICCCLPLGIVAITYATQVESKLLKGDIKGAKRSSKLAKNWAIAAIVGNLVINLLYFIYGFIQAALEQSGV